MFEGTLVESRGLQGTGTERWTALGSMTVQCALAGMLIAIPLLRPEALRISPLSPSVALPLLHKPPVVRVETNTTAASAAMSVPAAAVQTSVATQRFQFRPDATSDGSEPAMVSLLPMGPGGGGNPLSTISAIGTPSTPAVVRAREPGLAKVSLGVSQGLLLSPIQPVYPQIARAVRVQGAVVIEAIISKTGRLESVNVVSGPEMLRQAAKEAVATARYRPYLLNGEPTEVKTIYTVVFQLGG
jgi:periplasmic protein TonB